MAYEVVLEESFVADSQRVTCSIGIGLYEVRVNLSETRLKQASENSKF